MWLGGRRIKEQKARSLPIKGSVWMGWRSRRDSRNPWAGHYLDQKWLLKWVPKGLVHVGDAMDPKLLTHSL